MRVRALTIHQPWASAIAYGLKTIEVRRWRTNYRGCVLIHAGAGKDESQEAQHIWNRLQANKIPTPSRAVLAIADLRDCRRLTSTDALAACCACDNRWGFILHNVILLPRPIRARGNLRIMDSSDQRYALCVFGSPMRFMFRRARTNVNT